jgi:hypothetical protein
VEPDPHANREDPHDPKTGDSHDHHRTTHHSDQ